MPTTAAAAAAAQNISEINVRVAPSPTAAGNGLFATKDIPAGSTIISSPRPLIGELDLVRLEDTCSNCFVWDSSNGGGEGEDEGRKDVSACAGCKRVRYCSKQCQRQAWNRCHKHECKLLRDPALPPLPSSVRAALQLTLYMANPSVPEEDKQAVRRLLSHDHSTYDQLNEVESYEVTVQAASDLYERLSPGDPEAGQIREYVGKILRNSLTLTTPTLDPLGIAFDPLVCTANHSCDPNAIVLFDIPRLMMRSLAPIKKDEEVFISYIDNTNPLPRRRQELKSRYCFDCFCKKCNSNSNSSDSNASSETLSTLEAKAFETLDLSRTLHPITAKTKTLESLLLLSRNNNNNNNTSLPTHQPFATARLDLTSAYLTQNLVARALHHMSATNFLIDPILYPQPFHPVRVVHAFNLAKTLLLAYSSGNQTSRPVDQAVKKLFSQGFDFVVLIWRVLSGLEEVVWRSHGQGSWLEGEVRALVRQVRMGVGSERDLRVLESDPFGFWGVFEGWGLGVEF